MVGLDAAPVRSHRKRRRRSSERPRAEADRLPPALSVGGDARRSSHKPLTGAPSHGPYGPTESVLHQLTTSRSSQAQSHT